MKKRVVIESVRGFLKSFDKFGLNLFFITNSFLSMRFISTLNQSPEVGLEEAIFRGLPPDNGLYMPTEIPVLPLSFWETIEQKSLVDIAFEIAFALLKEDIEADTLRKIIEKAIDFEAPVIPLDDFQGVLELFHGPSMAFKDFGGRFMAQALAKAQGGKKTTIVTATSGDTGAAVAHAFYRQSGVQVVILFPKGKISPLQEKLFTTLGFETIASLIKYFGVVMTVLILHGLVTYGVILKLLTGLNPLIFFRKMRDAALFGFSTSSSNATMPVTMEAVTKKLGVKNSIASFTVPLGATINMDGTAIMQGVATVFIAQVFMVDLTLTDYLMVIVTATLASIGTAGVPGVGLIMLAMVLQQVGLPVEGIALIIGVDRLLDMTRTAVNITGDAMVSCIVGKSENEFDVNVFNDINAGNKEESVDFHHLR